MDVLLGPLFWLILTLIRLYIWAIIISVILSWLTAFRVINTHNRFVYLVGDFLYRVTEPALRPIRNFLPNFGGLDLSPLVLILLLYFLQQVVLRLAFKIGV
jgi:YggT family protein